MKNVERTKRSVPTDFSTTGDSADEEHINNLNG
jgi:hypothetical protein